MKHDLMRRLAAARPEHLDPAGPVDPVTRERELALAMAVSTDAAAAAQSVPRWRPARVVSRPMWVTGLFAWQ